MKLYLHIGSHKSGSSSIQSFIEDNKSLLMRAGFYIDETLTYKDQWKIAAWAGYPQNTDYFINTMVFCEDELRDLVLGYPEAFRQKILLAKQELGFHSCIISSEFLYSQCSNLSAIEKLATLFHSVFSSVTILFYFRDQVSMAKSVYAQLVSGPAKARMSYEVFVKTITEDSVFNYVGQLKKWAKLFGHKQIKVAQVGSKSGCLKGDELLLHFVSSIKLSNQPVVLQKKFANKSPNYHALQMMRYLNQLCANKYINLSFNNIVLRSMKKIIRSLPLKGEFPSDIDEIIANRFAFTNEEMARLFGDSKTR
ncbi:hypothetical protein FJ444_02255 [Aestuariibacter sp. GS-14]|uniref:hypothetical protein n=1 Tax=Aestuariibacter sp. GS-14 TaxID=2590670 RepID=UPI00112E1AF9|nr:hypothetical protein [Aestuariibacter sp. GS-14]TPV62112.1 hypothetical protein FJ444_02255 [Aestuariibacter sp. GS-14]